jgi:hypothetical protein
MRKEKDECVIIVLELQHPYNNLISRFKTEKFFRTRHIPFLN